MLTLVCSFLMLDMQVKPNEVVEAEPPDQLRIRPERAVRIGTMALGQSGYTLPWAMYRDSGGQYWVDPNYPVTEQLSGNSELLITSDPDVGYVADPSTVLEHHRPWDDDQKPKRDELRATNWIPVQVIKVSESAEIIY